jgi:hypothetical protein
MDFPANVFVRNQNRRNNSRLKNTSSKANRFNRLPSCAWIPPVLRGPFTTLLFLINANSKGFMAFRRPERLETSAMVVLGEEV